jgi:hypothetical protein
MRRRITALILFVSLVAVLGGCVAISGISVSQGGVVGGPVAIQVTFCATDLVMPIEHSGCAIQTNRPFDAAVDDDYQVLLAFRLPAGVTAPQAFASTAGEALTYTRSSSYEAELRRLVPLPADKAWVGYLSSTYNLSYSGAEPARESTVAPAFGLPRPADGGPFQGPFSYRPVVGGREVGDMNEPAPTDPVSCGEGINGDPTACIDSPLEAQLDSDFSVAQPVDLGIVAGNATASPGQTLDLPFSVRVAGNPGPGKVAALTATTTLPGVTATPSAASVPLAVNGVNRVTVPIAIPRSTGPGVFDVRLNAAVTGGQQRTTVARLTVRDRQAPVLSKLSIKPRRFRPATRKRPRRGADVAFSLSEPATARILVERCSKRAGKRKRRCVRYTAMRGAFVQQGAAGSNGFRFKGRLRGKALKPGPYRLAVTATDPIGNVGTTVRRKFTVRR